MAKKPRSPERAVKVVERAAKMSKFKPGLLDRDFAGDRMRSPGLGKVSFDYNTIDPALVRATGVKDVPLKDLVTDQPTVSVKTIRDKLLNPNARNSSALPKALLDPKTGKYVIPDGVHRRAVAAALGQQSMRVATGEVLRQPMPASAGTPRPGVSLQGKVGIGLAVAAPAVAAVNGYNRAKAAGAEPADAVVQGMRDATVMAAVGAVSAGAFTGLAAAAKMAAPRLAPALGPVGWAATAGMAAYGAVQGYRASGTMTGALKGAVGLDVTPVSTDTLTASLARVAPMQAPTGKAATGSTTPAAGRISRSDAAKYETASAERARASAPTEPADGNKRRGFQNPANMQAALAAQGRAWGGEYQNLNLED